jgi:indolepyruvate ferredoxin oxidoreductase, subunit iorB (EC 1.2.7.8)
VAEKAWFVACRECGIKAGSVQSGNTALLAALCASGLLPFGVDALRQGISKFLPPKLVDVNLAALEQGYSGYICINIKLLLKIKKGPCGPFFNDQKTTLARNAHPAKP